MLKGQAMQPDLPFMAGEWPRNNREDVRVRLDLYKNKVIVDCRTWWRDEAGELRPGRGGLTLSVRHLPALAEALDTALAHATALGLLSEPDASP
jgi:hypothetical protein